MLLLRTSKISLNMFKNSIFHSTDGKKNINLNYTTKTIYHLLTSKNTVKPIISPTLPVSHPLATTRPIHNLIINSLTLHHLATTSSWQLLAPRMSKYFIWNKHLLTSQKGPQPIQRPQNLPNDSCLVQSQKAILLEKLCGIFPC